MSRLTARSSASARSAAPSSRTSSPRGATRPVARAARAWCPCRPFACGAAAGVGTAAPQPHFRHPRAPTCRNRRMVTTLPTSAGSHMSEPQRASRTSDTRRPPDVGTAARPSRFRHEQAARCRNRCTATTLLTPTGSYVSESSHGNHASDIRGLPHVGTATRPPRFRHAPTPASSANCVIIT